MAKPVVNGIAKELSDTRLVMVDVTSSVGRVVASQFAVRGVPTLAVVDGDANVVLRQVGKIEKGAVAEAVGQ